MFSVCARVYAVYAYKPKYTHIGRTRCMFSLAWSGNVCCFANPNPYTLNPNWKCVLFDRQQRTGRAYS
jgi:hypothetical protein